MTRIYKRIARSEISNIENDCKEFIKNFYHIKTTKKIYDDDIFNLDETSLKFFAEGN